MAIKGTTKIQLFDAETGELTDEIVKENMVTNAVPNILNPALQMVLGDNVGLMNFLNYCSPIGKTLFGGILIFSEPLEENVDNIIPSVKDRNNIVGYAGQFSSVTGNNMKGSYNSNESTELENGFTHVWDFSTDQANGDIAAVALTSAMGGDSGWNATSNNAGRGNFIIPLSNKDFTQESKTSGDIDWFDGFNSIFSNVKYHDSNYKQYSLVTNGKYAMLVGTYNNSGNISVKYTVKKVATDITLNQYITNNDFSEDKGGVVTTGVWNSSVLSTSFTANYTRVQVKDNVVKYCFSNTDNLYLSNSSCILTFVDFVLNEDGTVTIKDPVSVTINNSDIITVISAEVKSVDRQRISLEAGYAYFDDDYVYLSTQLYNNYGIDTHFVRVSISNPTDIKLFVKPNGSTGTFSFGFFKGDIVLLDIKSKIFYRTSDFINYYVLDGVVSSPNYGYKVQDFNLTPMKPPYVGVLVNQIVNTTSSTGLTVKPCLIAPYLGTINNLDSVVTKTSSKTMKITYTIQNV